MVVYGITNVHVWYASIIFSKQMLPEVHTCEICWNLGFFDVNTPYLRVKKCALWVHRKWGNTFFWRLSHKMKKFCYYYPPKYYSLYSKIFWKCSSFLAKNRYFQPEVATPPIRKKAQIFFCSRCDTILII